MAIKGDAGIPALAVGSDIKATPKNNRSKRVRFITVMAAAVPTAFTEVRIDFRWPGNPTSYLYRNTTNQPIEWCRSGRKSRAGGIARI
jgi:hypothetical protein